MRSPLRRTVSASCECSPLRRVEVRHEPHPYLGLDSMCVLRVRGMGPAANARGLHSWSEVHRQNMKSSCFGTLSVEYASADGG